MHRYGGDRQDPDDVLSFNPVNQSSSPTLRRTRRKQADGCRELFPKVGYAETRQNLSRRPVRAQLRAVASFPRLRAATRTH